MGNILATEQVMASALPSMKTQWSIVKIKDLVQEGMVFTIEPGIYIPDWGGVRIEDMIRVTSHGAEVLTYLPDELRVI